MKPVYTVSLYPRRNYHQHNPSPAYYVWETMKFATLMFLVGYICLLLLGL